MNLIRGINNIKSAQQNCVATIGNFDGVHLGHQKVLQQLVEKARAENLPALVITFEPLPPEFFHADQAPARLLLLREKIVQLKKCGVDRVLCLRFNTALASLAAADFVKTILVEKLHIHTLIIGDDFRFGHKRQGDFALLQKLGQQYGFAVVPTQTVKLDGHRIGSSVVRAALAEGDLGQAAILLGRPFTLSGHVIYGDQRGRQLGFPTANISLRRRVLPLLGVFAVRVHGLAEQPLPGVANVGRRPTVDGKRRLLEVYLLDFNREIYGKRIEVEFIKKLRDEKRFDSLEELKVQIERDVGEGRRVMVRLLSNP